jgi:hypothetical protein
LYQKDLPIEMSKLLSVQAQVVIQRAKQIMPNADIFKEQKQEFSITELLLKIEEDDIKNFLKFALLKDNSQIFKIQRNCRVPSSIKDYHCNSKADFKAPSDDLKDGFFGIHKRFRFWSFAIACG